VNSSGAMQWSYNRGGEIARALRYAPDYPGLKVLVGVEQGAGDLPDHFELSQNYPNPFNASTTISFSLPQDTVVKLEVFNLAGEHVVTLVNERRAAGSYSVSFNAAHLTSGFYFYKMSAGDFVRARKLALIK
jgi:hypothetical protein